MCFPPFYWQIWLFRALVIVKKQIDASFLCVCPHTDDKMTQHFDNVVTSFYYKKEDRHKKPASICTGNVGKGWFQPKQSGIQQLSHKSYNNIVCLLNWYRAVKKFKSTCSSLADNE